MSLRRETPARVDPAILFATGAIALYMASKLREKKDAAHGFQYVHSKIDSALGSEGLTSTDLLEWEDEEGGGGSTCVARNVMGEFTGELSEEELKCIDHMTEEDCADPCLWYDPDKVTRGDDATGTTTEPPLATCARPPNDAGVCPEGYEQVDGCCHLLESKQPSFSVIETGLDIAKGEAGSLILAISPAIFKFLAGEGLTDGAKVAMKRAFKAMNMAKTGVRLIAKMQARLATKAGIKFGVARIKGTVGRTAAKQAAKAASKLAATMARKMAATMMARAAAKIMSMAAKASSVIAAPLAVFDFLSMMLDMGDPRGYNTFAENAIIQQARAVSEYQLQNFALSDGIEYPFTFPLTAAFPLAWETVVTPALEEAYLNAAMAQLDENHIMLLFEALLDDQPFPEAVDRAIAAKYDELLHANPKERDDLVYRVLTKGQVVTGVRWVDTGRVKPTKGKEVKSADLIALLTSKLPTSNQNLSLSRAIMRFGGMLDSIPFLSVEEADTVNLFTEDIVVENASLIPTGISLNAYSYVLINGKYYVPSDVGVPARFVHRCKSMTTKRRQGVSLSMEGVRWWNAWHKEEWFKYNDLFQRPPDMPDNYEPPPVALWSTEYLVLNEEDPGTDDKPNMKKKTLSEPCALYLPAGHIVAYCEKTRDAAFFGGLMGQNVPDMNSGVNPNDYGVYFDDGTGELGGVGCVYTDSYCTRMGLKHKYNHKTRTSDCWKDAGQDVSEMLFGSTVTRGIYEGAHSLLGFKCDPGCKPTEFCEGSKCWPKQEYDKTVGITAGWKCLSGVEDWGKCTECKEGTDCDGYTKTTSQNKVTCDNGECYCNKSTLCEVKRDPCLLPDKGNCDHDTTYCDHNEWCKSGFCDIAVGQSNVCRRADSEKNRSNGEFCNASDEQCKSGLCAHHKCTPKIKACKKKDCWQKLGSNDHPCNRDVDCENDSYCRKVTGQRNTCRLKEDVKDRPVGEYCDRHVDCTSGYCPDWLCENKKDSCLPTDKEDKSCDDKHCREDQECKSGFCDIVANQPNRCRRADSEKNRSNGEFCNASDEQCKSGLCAHHKCTPKIKACKKKDCWQKLGSNDHPCNRDVDCENDSNCRKVAMQRNTCRLKADIKNRGNGEYCDTDDQCSSNYACHGYTCKPKIPACETLSCNQSTPGTDMPCHRDGDCVDGAYCRKVAFERNTCRWKNPTNVDRHKYCDADGQCATQLCAYNLCRKKIPPCDTISCHQTQDGNAEPCHRDEDCEGTAYCRNVAFQRNTCRRSGGGRDVGMYCDQHTDCNTNGQCPDYLCRACTSDDHCGAGKFCSGYACHSKRGGAQVCGRNEECVSGKCSGGVCRDCLVNGDCPSAHPICGHGHTCEAPPPAPAAPAGSKWTSCKPDPYWSNGGTWACNTDYGLGYSGTWHDCGNDSGGVWWTARYMCNDPASLPAPEPVDYSDIDWNAIDWTTWGL